MNPEVEEQLTKALIDSLEIDFPFNNENGDPPYALIHPIPDMSAAWLCNYDEEGNLTSVFTRCVEGETLKQCDYLSKENAKATKDVLVGEGWTPMKKPELGFSYGGEKIK